MQKPKFRRELEKMTNPELQTLVKLQEETVQKINKNLSDLLKERDVEEKYLLIYQTVLKAQSDAIPKPATRAAQESFSIAPSVRRFEKKTIANAAKELLAEVNRPLSAEQIAKHLQNAGYPFTSRNPKRSVDVTLDGRKDLFERVAPHTYKLVNGLPRVESGG